MWKLRPCSRTVCCKLHMLMRRFDSLTYFPASISITEACFCVFNSAFVCLVQQRVQSHTHTGKTHMHTHFLSISHSISLPLFLIGKGGIGWGGMIVLGGSQKTDCLLLSSAHLTLTVTE